MRLQLYFYFVYIIFEVAFFHSSIGEGHLAIAMLDASIPLALVPTSVSPPHLSVSVAVIFEVLSLVLIATGPDKATESMLTIVLVFTIVNVAGRAFGAAPLPFTVFHSCLKHSYVSGSVSPRVLTFTLRLAV